MPVHISPALSARQVTLDSLLFPVPAFYRALLEWEGGWGKGEGGDRCPESLPADASYADVAIWIETDSLLNATVPVSPPADSPFEIHIYRRSDSSRISPPSTIYLVKHSYRTFMWWQTDIHTCTGIRGKNIHGDRKKSRFLSSMVSRSVDISLAAIS